MLTTRAYQLLVLLCPALALATGAVLAARYPDLIWYTGTGMVAMLGLLLYCTRPNPLRERIRQFDLALMHTPAGMMMLDLNGQVLWANAASGRLFEVEASSIHGTRFEDLLEGEAWTTIQAQRQSLLQGEQLEIEGRIRVASGKRPWTRGHASLVHDERGKPEFILVQVLDLTAARSALSATSVAESRLQQTLELTSDLIITLDQKGRIVRTNKRTNDSFAATSKSLLGASIIEFLDPADRNLFVRTYNKSRASPGAAKQIDQLKIIPGGMRSRAGASRQVSMKLISLPGSNPSTMLICQDTTAVNESRDLLRSSEARFSRIFHSSPDAILILRHIDSIILDFNPSFTRLLGYTREDAIGMAEMDMDLFCDPGDRAAMIERLRDTSECNELETRLRTRSGEVLTVEISLRYIEIDGELCTMCIGRDISKRIIAERARRESEEKFERIFAQSPDGIIILSQDNHIHDVNDAFLLASEYRREELIGHSVFDLDAITDMAVFEQVATSIADDGRFSNVEMTFRTSSGRLIPALVSGTSIELGGKPYTLCIAKDIQDLRAAQQQLNLSEQRFRGAFENAPIGIMLVNDNGKIFQANRFAADLLSYTIDTLEGVHISRLVPPEDRGQFKETLGRLFSGQDETVRAEKRMLCRDGLQIWTNFHIGMQRSDDGNYSIVQITDITEMKQSQRRIERMAFYDTLTDLANRRLFYDRLGSAITHAVRSKTLAALLYLDLDQFKRVNDTLGHEIGDVLLQEVATRLTHCVRDGDTVGRPGGDEFTILLTDIKTPSDAGYVAEKVLQTLSKPISLSGHQLVVTTSIGITIIPEDGTEANALMKNADLAMYRAKEHGRNNYQYYSEEMNTNAVHRLRTEYELRRALERNEFELYYQPKVRLSDQQVTGVECLVRWQHPERGLLSPVEFIDIAEETGVIVDLGTWVIEEACRAGRTIVEQTGREFEIAVNISPRQFKDPNLVANIRKCLRETGLNPNTLEVEITETMLMGDIEAANQTVQKLHELGVKLAIDDFGTGYSSLNYLKKFPIDTVKVDRSFIMDIPDSADDRAITSAVIAMAHRLNMAVVAEGVETRDQLEFLQSNGCEYAQGYLFSKPVPLANVRSMLAPNVRLLRGS